MRLLVTGSAGHLGEALVRVLRKDGHDVVGLDVLDSPSTTVVGSIADRACVRGCVSGVEAILHTATLHKPHASSRRRQEFVDTNVTGTLTLLEEGVAAGIGRLVFTSSTSAFGRALTPAEGEPAAWITEGVTPVPRNVYGATKTAAEDLCELVAHDHGLACVILRTSRFFPEPDDRDDVRSAYDDLNLKVNELLYRRVDLEDAVDAHRLALQRAPAIGFGRYVVSATTPFAREDLAALRRDAPRVVRRRFPDYERVYAERGWTMLPSVDRVYVNALARRELGWAPRYDFRLALDRLARGEDPRSALALAVGAKGYDRPSFALRAARADDVGFLELMLREAAAGPPEREREPLHAVLAHPQTSRYVAGWGRPGDVGRVAQRADGELLGATWYRRFTAGEPGYGFVAGDVPELALGVVDGARGGGVGSALLRALIADAAAGGHPALSLSVALDNPALRLYERLGFVAVEVADGHQTMRLDLDVQVALLVQEAGDR